MEAIYKKYILEFKSPSGTSRGVLTRKESWFLTLKEGAKVGIGECGILRGLSIDDVPGYEEKLKWTCTNIHLGQVALWEALTDFPSIQFGLEQAFLSLNSHDPFLLFPSPFTDGDQTIPINGLVWMGDEKFMHRQLAQKLAEGFKCIKMKIGAIEFEREIALLASIRKEYGEDEIELRVDANGAFSYPETLGKLVRLAPYAIHSIEQPIRAGQLGEMRDLCERSPIPIALDEELIGIAHITDKEELLQTINPQYIIIKPSLIGGIQGSAQWISIAEHLGIKWWITSALESNIGLNAIAQWTFTLGNNLPQGLGTGSLYTNNFDSPLQVKDGRIGYVKNKNWQHNLIEGICI